MLLATYSFKDVFLNIVEIALLFLWIWVAVSVVFDVFRSNDLSNGAKALWVLLIVLLPLIGVLAYLIFRGEKMHEHQEADQARSEAYQRFVNSAADPAVDDLTKLADLRERGVLDEEEFQDAKKRVLAASGAA